jgi:HlyD family secretion protein
MKKLIVLLLLLLVVGCGAVWYARRDNRADAPLRTAPVHRGDLVATISATGTVQAEELIDIGAQVAGRIIEFGTDVEGKSVDYTSKVRQGQILARIDDLIYKAELAQAKAQLEQSKASVRRAEADLSQMKAKLAQAERDWARARNLGGGDALSQSSYDAYQGAYESAAANIGVGEASVAQARASVDQAMSSVERAERNLAYTVIPAPVDGVIIDRRVNIGQTVVASLNAPSLFLIAKDLKRVQLWVPVNEADIGSIHPGQAVTFTVDSFAGESFEGKVNKVRLNAQVTQNVVTYLVEVNTDNSNGRLLPYQTANVRFETTRADEVLTVPNAALRWTPKADLVAPDAQESPGSEAASPAAARPAGAGGGPGGTGGPGGPGRRGPRAPAAEGTEQRTGTVWVRDGQFVRPVKVLVGVTDGIDTEVRSDQLNDGTEVVVGEVIAASGGPAQQTNPFGPPQFGRNRGGRPGGGGGGGGGGRGR